MKLNQNKTLLTAVLALFSGVALVSAADCDRVGEKTTVAIEKNPSELLVIVEDMISKNDGCACEVVKAAIESVKGDKEQVGQIVMTAVTASAQQAAEITECALAAAPEAAAEIRAGLSEVFEGGEAYSAKGKQVMIEEVDFEAPPVAVSGVYLIAPVAPSSAALAFDAEDVELTASQIKRLARALGLVEDRKRPSRGGGGGGGQTPTN